MLEKRFESYTIGYCLKCGADAVYVEEWDDMEWAQGNPGCRHSLAPRDEIMDKFNCLIDRIRQCGSFQMAYHSDGEDDSKAHLFGRGGQ
jgi:hypothetical protein